MTDTVAAAWITVGGTVFIALVSVLTQLLITRFVIKSERQKIAQQVEAEHRAQARAKKSDILLESIAELLAESDPQVKATIDYGRVVSLIHRAQLVLDLNVPDEASLNAAINRLGLGLQEYSSFQSRPVRERLPELKKFLGAHADVAMLAGAVLKK